MALSFLANIRTFRAIFVGCLPTALVGGMVGGHAAPSATALGKPVFDRLCGGCHQMGVGAANGIGPQLNGILGMAAADQPGYAYSSALQHSALVWTNVAFLSFMADPTAAMPGTRMKGPKVDTATERQAILTYVQRFRADGTMR